MSEVSPPSETPVAIADAEDAAIGKPAGGEPRSDQANEAGSTATGDEAQNEQHSRPTELPSVEGKVIGWNDGGFHVVVNGKTGFCPRSEMEVGAPRKPKDYVDETFNFSVLRVEKGGKRIVLSRKARLESDRKEALGKLRGEMEQGQVLTGTVASLTDFGAFIELGGVQGLLHVSEISRRRINDPREILQEGEEVEVKILAIEKGGRRISLSMKALEPDPWKDADKLFPQGKVVKGVVERTANFGAFIEIAPGLTGLLPTSNMSLPRDASAARVYHPGKEVSVQIVSVDRRRRRVSLGLEGSGTEGSKADFDSFRKQQKSEEPAFNAMAAALDRARGVSSD
ncbi:MAG: S1 RNA-binding domain-containing protein [Acidobacteria bacterium]|nr:S1 RNA-binding domain-containing protein [Acidobacteriota bacterium]